MSNPLLAMFRDPRERQFVEKLIERTEAGTLTWTRTPTTYETVLKNGTRIGFVNSSNAFATLITGSGWAQFSVRKQDGAEIIKIEGSVMPFPGGNDDPLRVTINKLYALVSKKGKDQLDDVFGELDNT
jgi:hypothetical protein